MKTWYINAYRPVQTFALKSILADFLEVLHEVGYGTITMQSNEIHNVAKRVIAIREILKERVN